MTGDSSAHRTASGRGTPSFAEFVLVTGATGNQGGAVARALLQAGVPVHALVRDTSAPRAVALARAGATIVAGDLEDRGSLVRASTGATGAFSVQTPGLADDGGATEVRHAANLAAALRATGVRTVVHTSVAGVEGEPIDEARWGSFPRLYREAKLAAESLMREVGATALTVLRPALFMENLARPSFYFPDPARPDHLLVALDLDVVQGWVALRDIGAAAAAVFGDPGRLGGTTLELAGDRRTLRHAVSVVSSASGREITVPDSPAEARADGVPAALALYQGYVSAHPYPGRPEDAAEMGLAVTTLEQWAGSARLV